MEGSLLTMGLNPKCAFLYKSYRFVRFCSISGNQLVQSISTALFGALNDIVILSIASRPIKNGRSFAEVQNFFENVSRLILCTQRNAFFSYASHLFSSLLLSLLPLFLLLFFPLSSHLSLHFQLHCSSPSPSLSSLFSSCTFAVISFSVFVQLTINITVCFSIVAAIHNKTLP